MSNLTWWQDWANLNDPQDMLQTIDEIGLLHTYYPELEALRNVPQDPRWHPEGEVLIHTFITTDRMAAICSREGITRDDRFILMMAALCHDMGKATTTKQNPQGRWIAPGHDKAGEEPTRNFLRRIKVNELTIERIVGLVLCHMAHAGFVGSRSHVKRLMKKLQNYYVSIQMLSWLVEADASARPPAPKGMPVDMQKMITIAIQVERMGGLDDPVAHSDRIVQGRHVREWLKLPQGVMIGRIVNAAYAEQQAGTFDNLEAAQAWVIQQNWNKKEGD